jgi:DNA polymerase/3'-5' exonuclease PolX
MNNELIYNFTILKNYYISQNDFFRAKAYENAIKSIENFKGKINTIGQISGKNKLQGIGSSTLSKIEEYVKTGKIKKVEDIKAMMLPKGSEDELILQSFKNIWGVGPVKASSLLEAGFRSIEELRANPSMLTDGQKIGLKYYEELLRPLSREYINIYQVCVRYILNKAFGKNSYKLIVAGSYRRKKMVSGDIDILISSRVFTLREMVDVLVEKKLITDILGIRSEKFMGIGCCNKCKINHFRIDIEFLPEKEIPTGLLYFTGSKEFNISIRGEALKKGYKLNQHGLYNQIGESVDIKTERGIFDELDMPYISPENR